MATDVDEQPGIRPADKLMSASISRDAGFLLAKLHAAGSVLNNRALAQFGLKERSYSVLALATSELEPTQREMAEFLSLDPSQIVALIDELEQRGLVIRAPGTTGPPGQDRLRHRGWIGRLPAGRGRRAGGGIHRPRRPHRRRSRRAEGTAPEGTVEPDRLSAGDRFRSGPGAQATAARPTG